MEGNLNILILLFEADPWDKVLGLGGDWVVRGAIGTKPNISLVSQILRFHVPLGLNTTLIASSFTIINAGIGRTAMPQTSLAAFALGHTIINILAVMVVHSQPLLVILGLNPVSWKNARRVTIGLTVLVVMLIGVIGYTSVGDWLYMRVFGAPAGLMPEILQVARLCLILPIIYGVRATANASLMLQRRTALMSTSMIFRLGIMAFLAYILPDTNLSGAAVGATIWLSGMGVEALSSTIFAQLQPRSGQVEIGGSPASIARCLQILWPLLLNGVSTLLIIPIINAGLARTMNPEQNLAAFQVAWSLAWMFIAFIQMNLRQTTLVFLDRPQNLAALKRVGFVLQTAVSLLLAVLVFSGLADWVLRQVVAVDPTLLAPARNILIVFILLPFVSGMFEIRAGIALRKQNTGALALASVACVSAWFGELYPSSLL